MATTTLGVKLDSRTHNRLKTAAHSLDRTPHWFMKVAIRELIKKVESGSKIESFIDEELLSDDTWRHSVAIRNHRESF